MAIAAIIYLIQIGLIVHVLRTGRNMYWVFILIIAPGIGGLAYLIAELLPELMQDRRARRALRSVKKTLNPGAELQQRQKELERSGSVDAARRLASELLESGQSAQAIQVYQSALTGLYEHDPDLMLGLATAQFRNGEFAHARDTLDLLIDRNPDFKSPEGHLLYARAVEACGDDDKALEEYKSVAAYYAGAEAQFRYGQILERLGNTAAALAEYEEILTNAELAPRHYRKAQREWISQAKDGIRRISG